MIIKIVTSDII